HAYPMYTAWARYPLDPELVPFACALTAALCGKPVLAEEWGGCTAPPGEPSQTWRFPCCGEERVQFMASEEELAEHVAAVLPRLVEVGATGALLWCFADYHEDLYVAPPCDRFRHERHFGLVRPDGSLKPHAEVVEAFAASAPRVRAVDHGALLDVTPDEYYRAPADHAVRLYRAHLQRRAAGRSGRDTRREQPCSTGAASRGARPARPSRSREPRTWAAGRRRYGTSSAPARAG